ncbi:MAG: DUF1285 domain-containing protein [Pseudomonadales bacterium]
MPDAPYSLLAELEKVKQIARPPIHKWNPDNVQDIDMEVKRDGSWYYMGTPIERQRLVRLFSTVLRREDDGHYYLVTPVEKCRIKVEDAPFNAVLLTVSGSGRDQQLTFTTNVADEVTADRDHPLRLVTDEDSGEPAPYVLVRDGLEALVVRSVYYQMTDLLTEHEVDGQGWHGVWSRGVFFPFVESEQLV